VKSFLRRRPSPALLIAVLALFISLGGVSYGVATGFIDSREIKNNTITSLDLRDHQVRTRDIRNNEVRGFDIRNSTVRGIDVGLNTLTGADIAEAELAKVPEAAAADTAATAGSADSVDGVNFHRFAYVGQEDSAFVPVFELGGLRVEARCVGGGPFLEVRASTTVVNSEISSNFPGFVNSDTDFDPGDSFYVVDNPNNGSGLVSFAAGDGGLVNVHALTRQDLNDVRGTTNDCGFFGIASGG
jgi:hypothetical protein